VRVGLSKVTLRLRLDTVKKIILGLVTGCIFASATTNACTPYNFVDREKSKTNVYAGLNWNLEGGKTPALVLGVFHTKVQTDGDTKGGNLAFHVNLKNKVKPGKLNLSFLKGQEDLQGEIGFGYDFLKSKPLVLLGVNAPYVSAGVNIYSNPGIVPFAQLHTQGDFDRPGKECKNVGVGMYNNPDCTNGPPPP